MKIASNSSYETLIINALQHGQSVDDLHANYIVEHVRQIRELHDTVRAEYRTDGRDVLDLFTSMNDEISIVPEEKTQLCYSSTDFYQITIGELQFRLGVNMRQGEECRAVEVYYGSHYIFNAIFMPPEAIVDTMTEAAYLFTNWQRTWDKMMRMCQKQVRLKTMGEMAVVAYLKLKIANNNIFYSLTDHRTTMDICFRVHGGLKLKISVPHVGFQYVIDEAVERLIEANKAMQTLSDIGKLMREQGNEMWINE